MSRIGPLLSPSVLRSSNTSQLSVLDAGGAQFQPAFAAAAALALDGLIAAAAPFVAALLDPNAPHVSFVARVALLVTVLTVAAGTAAGAYRPHVLFRRRMQVRGMLRAGAAAVAVAMLASVTFAAPQDHTPMWGITAGLLLLGGLTLGRLGVARVMNSPFGRRFAPRTVIVGSGLSGAGLATMLRGLDRRAMRLIGRLDDDVELFDDPQEPAAYLGPIEQVFALVRRGVVDQVVLALPWSEKQRILALIDRLADYPVHVRLAADLISQQFPRRVRLDPLAQPVLLVADRPMSGWSGVLKRAEDIVVAGTALMICAIPMAAIALLIRLDSPGPVLFRQKRTGFNNGDFEMLKFRTMHANRLEFTIRNQATRNDPRVTRVGAVLRRTSLDELPQILNVLRGDMSIVGPRPHAPGTRAGGRPFEEVVERYAARHRVKPGLTGLAQVRGLRGETRTEETLIRRVESDLEYIDSWSLWLDLTIMARTVIIVACMQNAY